MSVYPRQPVDFDTHRANPSSAQNPDWLHPHVYLISCVSRPRGALLSPSLTYRGGGGLVTNEQMVPLVIAFTEPVSGLTTASFAITGPASGATVAALQLVRSTSIDLYMQGSIQSLSPLV